MTSDKAPDAFRTISEAAEDLDLPQHVLRFWETRFTQIKPLKRGGGRRYYRPDDVEFLRGLKHLLHAERYTIKGVQKIIKEQGIKAVQTAWKDAPVAIPPAKATVPAPAMPVGPIPISARARLEAALAELTDCRRVIASFRQA
jgi:DNA-binding transcriptional MerR regulator